MRDDTPRERPDLERVREALGEPGERPHPHVTPRPDEPEQQREARQRLEPDDEEADEG